MLVVASLVFVKSGPSQQRPRTSPHVPSLFLCFIAFLFCLGFAVSPLEGCLPPCSSSWPSAFCLSGAHLQKALFTCLCWLPVSASPIILYALYTGWYCCGYWAAPYFVSLFYTSIKASLFGLLFFYWLCSLGCAPPFLNTAFECHSLSMYCFFFVMNVKLTFKFLFLQISSVICVQQRSLTLTKMKPVHGEMYLRTANKHGWLL